MCGAATPWCTRPPARSCTATRSAAAHRQARSRFWTRTPRTPCWETAHDEAKEEASSVLLAAQPVQLDGVAAPGGADPERGRGARLHPVLRPGRRNRPDARGAWRRVPLHADE